MSFLGVPGFVHAQYDLQARSATRNTRNLLRAARIVRDRLERAKTNVTCCHLLPAKKNVSNEPRGDHKKQLAQIRRASETIAHLRNVQLLCLLHMFLEGCVVPSSAVPVSRWSQKKKTAPEIRDPPGHTCHGKRKTTPHPQQEHSRSPRRSSLHCPRKNKKLPSWFATCPHKVVPHRQ